MKVAQNYWESIASARMSSANKGFEPLCGQSYRAPIGKHLEAKKRQDHLDMLSALGFAVQAGFKRIQSWHVPPNWSRVDWLEELAAIATAAAWQAVRDFDAERGVPLAGFGYCRVVSHCLARYRKEWRYALHLVSRDRCKKKITTFEHPDLTTLSPAQLHDAHSSNDHLRRAIGALPAEQRRLIEQLFWEGRSETEVATTMSINQSTVSRRKRAILNRLRISLR